MPERRRQPPTAPEAEAFAAIAAQTAGEPWRI